MIRPLAGPFGFKKILACCATQLTSSALAVVAIQLPALAYETPVPADLRASMGTVQIDPETPRAMLVAPAKAAAERLQSLPQIFGQLPQATVVAPPKAAPARAEAGQQLGDRLPPSTLMAPAPTAAGKVERTAQPLLPSRLALQSYRVRSGDGPLDKPGSTATQCADPAGQTQAECLLWPEAGPDWQRLTAFEVDPVTGVLLIPGVTLNPRRSARSLDEMASYLASLSREMIMSRSSPTADSANAHSDGSGGPGDSPTGTQGTTIKVNPGTVVTIESIGTNNVISVDLLRASAASYISDLTLNGYGTALFTAAPGSTVQLSNVTLAGGTGSQTNSLVLRTAPNGTIALLGGSSTGTGSMRAMVKDVFIVQTGGPHMVKMGLNGTSGTTLGVAQSTTAPSVLTLDIHGNNLSMSVSQSGSEGHVASGIMLKAALGSSLSLSQR